MIFFISNKKIGLVLAFFLVTFYSHPLVSEVQAAPEIWITWKANSYIPAEFSGKAMPSDGALVNASFEVIESGRFANLSGYEIYWHLNNELIKSGIGEQYVSFRVPIRGNHELRATVNNYSGGTLVKTIEVPGVRPEVVIAAPYPRGVFSSPRIQVKALPYFFTTSDPNRLNFSWSVNGQKPASSDNISFLDINLGGQTTEGYKLNISLSISHPNNFALSGSSAKTLTFED